MIPRVTRRLIERERGMVQSGAVFVFDEHESGIKRWTDGLVWSPSRILGNFLVYRETDKKPNPSTPMSGPSSSSPQQQSPSSLPQGGMPPPYDASRDSYQAMNPILGTGALPRPRSGSDGGSMDRQRERQLVGSLTNSYKFKGNGLVKKTMSVTVNGFAQHMISYYSVEDVLHGKLRSPSTVPELAALEISPEYLHKQNFRFPPMIEIGQDGIPRYRGEPEEPTSPTSPTTGGMASAQSQNFPSADYDPYHGASMPAPMRIDPTPRQRSSTVPMPIPLPSPASTHAYIPPGPSSSSSAYFDHSQISPPPIVRQNSNSSLHSMRPGSSSRRYDPYGPPSPRVASLHAQQSHQPSHQSRRQSQPIPMPGGTDYYGQHMDIKPQISPIMAHHNPYNYQPPSTAPSAFADFGTYNHPAPPTQYAPQYAAWQPPPTAPGRFHPQQPRDYGPPSSSGSSGSGGQPMPPTTHTTSMSESSNGWNAPVVQPAPGPVQSHATWETSYVQEPPAEWRGHNAGTSVG